MQLPFRVQTSFEPIHILLLIIRELKLSIHVIFAGKNWAAELSAEATADASADVLGNIHYY